MVIGLTGVPDDLAKLSTILGSVNHEACRWGIVLLGLGLLIANNWTRRSPANGLRDHTIRVRQKVDATQVGPITPRDILKATEGAPLLSIDAIQNSFIGLAVEWELNVENADRRHYEGDDEIDLVLIDDPTCIHVTCSVPHKPDSIAPTLRAGDRVRIRGIIGSFRNKELYLRAASIVHPAREAD